MDLGQFSPHSFGISFADVFEKNFEKKLILKLSELPQWRRDSSREQSQAKLVLHFLERGTLPWWADESETDLGKITTQLLRDQPELVRLFLYENRFKANVWERVAFQFNDEEKKLVCLQIEELNAAKVLFGIWIKWITSKVKGFSNFEFIKPEDIILNILIRSAPEILGKTELSHIVWDIFKNHIEEIFSENKVLIQQVKKVLSVFDSENIWNKPVKIENLNYIEKSFKDLDVHYEKEDKKNALEYNIVKKLRENKKLFLEQITQDQYTKEQNPDKYIVKHAGLVLLAPFIKTFFQELDLLDDSDWRNKGALFKAVHLLKYLSTGKQKMPEYSLTLEKILCSIPIHEPVPLKLLLQDKEMKEADFLLKSVIKHWKVLRNTSIHGLRETFFKRDGIISGKENGWLLQVERKSPDVLLDGIPWGYSTISLPWNKYIIFTEW
jgi:uncharacterized protein Usg